ncbi:MAG: hypothetical protein LUD72_14480 [Bacteroidales bacterium]|nr:hypothetical protein [Bacteroidales bacterium]
MTDKTTYEEFMGLSKKPPVWKGKTLYELSVVSIELYRRRYPRYDVGTLSQGFFNTREEAEQAMRQHKEEKDKYAYETYCYYLHEYPCSRIINIADSVSCRVYDASGQLVEQTLCSNMRHLDDSSNEFFGRTENKLRFKKGDIVEVLGRDEVWLAVVTATPPSPERVWTIHNNFKRTALKEHLERGGTEEDFAYDGMCVGWGMDAMDDSYTVIDGPSADYHNQRPLQNSLKNLVMWRILCTFTVEK